MDSEWSVMKSSGTSEWLFFTSSVCEISGQSMMVVGVKGSEEGGDE